MNVATKIGVLVASALAISLLVQIFYLFPQIKSREFGLQRVQNEAAADNIASEIGSLQEDVRYMVEMIARTPEVRSLDLEQQERILSLSLRGWPRLETVSVGIGDIGGTIIALESRNPSAMSSMSDLIGTDVSGYDYFESCVSTGETYYSGPFYDDSSGLVVVTIATPIVVDDGSVGGIIFAEIPVETVARIIDDNRLDQSESVYIVDKGGIVIAHSAEDMTELPAGTSSLDYSDYPVVQDLANRHNGVGQYEYNGETYLACYVMVGASGWGVVFQEPLSVVMAKSTVVANFLLGINAAIFVVAVLVALFLARRITDPLSNLVDYAERIERGDYTAELEVKGSDEIASVTSAIKSMVQQMVAMQEKELAAIVSSMKDGLIVLDKDRRVTRINPYMEQILGVRATEVLNKSIPELETDSQLLSVARLAQAQVPDDEIVLAGPDERVLKVYSSGLKGSEDEDMGEVRVVHDVTRERELDQMKLDFIANTSHELRTPLHSIRGFVKLMLDGKVPDVETQREFLSIVDEQSQHLSNLVNNILDTSALESGEWALEKQPVSMQEIIDKVVANLRRIAEENEVVIEASMSRTLLIVEGDSEKLEQVVTNLIHNAIKFSPRGSKVLIAAEADNGNVLVRVTDEGTGIPASAMPHLFQKFFKVDGSMPWASSGTGLGLYIVKRIMEAHGGQVSVDSELGKGATFSFKMPLSHDNEGKQQEGGQHG